MVLSVLEFGRYVLDGMLDRVQKLTNLSCQIESASKNDITGH